MTCRLLFASLAASLVCMPAAAAAGKPTKGGLDSALANASSFCERAASRAPGTGFPAPLRGPVSIHDGTPPAMGTPDLVKRFAATQESGCLASSAPFFVHFLTSDAAVWAVVYDKLPSCDIMVTGAAGDMPAVAGRLTQALGKNGWLSGGSTAATAAMPLARHVLVKKAPKPGAPDFTLRLRIRALGGPSADPAGVQLEMSFLGGS
ncbi:MAG TPA: hypothetical protein VF650_07490 [Allosphingosinicella sp.]|jgi:hypothetical protein